MKTLIQRVLRVSVEVDRETISAINKGMLILLGVKKGDTEKELEYLIKKIPTRRI